MCPLIRWLLPDQVMSTEHRLSEALYGNPGVDDSPDALNDIRAQYQRQLEDLQTAVVEWEDIHHQELVHRSQRLLHCVQTCLQVLTYAHVVSRAAALCSIDGQVAVTPLLMSLYRCNSREITCRTMC